MIVSLSILVILLSGGLSVALFALFRERAVTNQLLKEKTEVKDRNRALRIRNDRLRARLDVANEDIVGLNQRAKKIDEYHMEYEARLTQRCVEAEQNLELVLHQRSFLPNYKPHRLMSA